MATSFSWLHLTDFHQGMKEQDSLLKGVMYRFFEDLERLHDKCGPWDLVLFTGDLTQRGSVKEFQKLNEILDQLWDHFKHLGFEPKFLAVPGNHDLVRPKKLNDSTKLLLQWKDEEVKREFLQNEKSSYRKVITRAFKNYTDWFKNRPFKPENINEGLLPGDFSVTIEKGDAKLGIVGLNTSFFQLNDDNELIVDTQQFHQACGGNGPIWAEQRDACLLMTHHPPSWLTSDSQEQLNGEITDRGRFAAHLCGHLHEVKPSCFSEGGAEFKYIWQSRSLFGLEYVEVENAGKKRKSRTLTWLYCRQN
ncbi:metallophosphoesterase [Beggiatoa sp. PS]|nr:metallophosphoesterase [Beggiatoa sp. PS]